jgi:hypothetical protein
LHLSWNIPRKCQQLFGPELPSFVDRDNGRGVNLGLAYGISVFSFGGGTRVYRCQVLNATETGFVGVITGGS